MLPLQSESIKELAPALVEALGSLKNVGKKKQGHGYKYAELADIIEDSRPILKEHGLTINNSTTFLENGDEVLITQIFHTSSEWIKSYYKLDKIDMNRINAAQAKGAAITYARRYSMACMLNIAQEDDDAASVTTTSNNTGGVTRTASGNTASEKQLNFLKSLLTKNNKTIQDYLNHNKITSESEITGAMAKASIDKMFKPNPTKNDNLVAG